MTAGLPKPEKRRGFTARQRNEVGMAQDWKCAMCGLNIFEQTIHIDHIQPLDLLGKHAPENWQALCIPCHARKTRTDAKKIAKGRRIRGETKQGPKQKIPQRKDGGWPAKGSQKIKSRNDLRRKG